MGNQLMLFNHNPFQKLDKNTIEMMKSDNFKELGMQLAIGKGWSQRKAFKEVCKQNFIFDEAEWIDSVVERAENYYFIDIEINGFCIKYCEIRDFGFHVTIKDANGKGLGYKLFDWGPNDQYDAAFKKGIKMKFYAFVDLYWQSIKQLLNI